MQKSYEIVDTSPLDLVAKPLFDALQAEYSTRYRAFRPDSDASANEDPAELFLPPDGAFIILLLSNGEVVGGGAFKRYDGQTAELRAANATWT